MSKNITEHSNMTDKAGLRFDGQGRIVHFINNKRRVVSLGESASIWADLDLANGTYPDGGWDYGYRAKWLKQAKALSKTIDSVSVGEDGSKVTVTADGYFKIEGPMAEEIQILASSTGMDAKHIIGESLRVASLKSQAV